jgi:hypothetical protein
LLSASKTWKKKHETTEKMYTSAEKDDIRGQKTALKIFRASFKNFG